MALIDFVDCIDIVGNAVKPFSDTRLYLSTGALQRQNIDKTAVEEVTFESRPSRANVNVSAGDIIFAKMKNTVKVLEITEKEKDYIVSTGFFAIRPRNGIDREFVVQYILSDDFNEQKDKYCTGATQKALTNSGLAKIKIPQLDISTQQSIGKALSLVDIAIQKRKEQISVLDKLCLDTFIEMFGDPISNPKSWDKYTLESMCEIVTGSTPPRANPNNYGSFIEWIKSDNINTEDSFLTTAAEYLSEEGAKRGRVVESGAILMTCIAGSLSCIGNVAIANRRVSFNQQINAVVPCSDIESYFLYFMFRLAKSYIQGDVSMSLKGILNKGKLSAMSFIFPPVSIQKEFSKRIKVIDEQIMLLKRSLSDLVMTRESALQKAFNGELFQ